MGYEPFRHFHAGPRGDAESGLALFVSSLVRVEGLLQLAESRIQSVNVDQLGQWRRMLIRMIFVTTNARLRRLLPRVRGAPEYVLRRCHDSSPFDVKLADDPDAH